MTHLTRETHYAKVADDVHIATLAQERPEVCASERLIIHDQRADRRAGLELRHTSASC